jgi:hypothetical protein
MAGLNNELEYPSQSTTLLTLGGTVHQEQNGATVATTKNGSQHITNPPIMRPRVRADRRMRRNRVFRIRAAALLDSTTRGGRTVPTGSEASVKGSGGEVEYIWFWVETWSETAAAAAVDSDGELLSTERIVRDFRWHEIAAAMTVVGSPV